jgi:hypothetical protein
MVLRPSLRSPVDFLGGNLASFAAHAPRHVGVEVHAHVVAGDAVVLDERGLPTSARGEGTEAQRTSKCDGDDERPTRAAFDAARIRLDRIPKLVPEILHEEVRLPLFLEVAVAHQHNCFEVGDVNMDVGDGPVREPLSDREIEIAGNALRKLACPLVLVVDDSSRFARSNRALRTGTVAPLPHATPKTAPATPNRLRYWTGTK